MLRVNSAMDSSVAWAAPYGLRSSPPWRWLGPDGINCGLFAQLAEPRRQSPYRAGNGRACRARARQVIQPVRPVEVGRVQASLLSMWSMCANGSMHGTMPLLEPRT